MKHLLVFKPWSVEDQKPSSDFMNLYWAFVGNADNPNRAKSIEETRAAIRILDAFDAISSRQPIPDKPGQEVRILNTEGGSMNLNGDEYRLLQRCVEEFVGQAPLAMARGAMDLKGFVDNAPMES